MRAWCVLVVCVYLQCIYSLFCSWLTFVVNAGFVLCVYHLEHLAGSWLIMSTWAVPTMSDATRCGISRRWWLLVAIVSQCCFASFRFIQLCVMWKQPYSYSRKWWTLPDDYITLTWDAGLWNEGAIAVSKMKESLHGHFTIMRKTVRRGRSSTMLWSPIGWVLRWHAVGDTFQIRAAVAATGNTWSVTVERHMQCIVGVDNVAVPYGAVILTVNTFSWSNIFSQY